MRRSAPPRRVNPKRKAKNWTRAYGSPERVEWVRALPCAVCGVTPCDNAHVSSGGTSRKADADQIVPLCSGVDGCHAELHRIGRDTFEQRHRIDLGAVARNIARTWERFNTTTEEAESA